MTGMERTSPPSGALEPIGGAVPLESWSVTCSVLVTALLCLSGVWYFRRTERTFADVI